MRDQQTHTSSQPPVRPVAGLVLASGMSRRFAGANKLLVPIGGVPVVRRTVQAYLAAGLDPVTVVLGHEANLVGDALLGLPIQTVINPDFAQGQSRALGHGVHALPDRTSAAVIGVGDQPLLTGSVIRLLVDSYIITGRSPVVPRYAGRRGNPVLFDRSLFPELLAVTGDQGGRPVIERHRDEILWLDLPDPRPGADLDSEEDYAILVSWLPE
jgi:molybdenum cofactor cytidylyltransferase